MPNDLSNQPIRVPRTDWSLLAIPCLKMAPRAVSANRTLFAGVDYSLNGKSLSALRQETRREALVAARSFTSTLIGEDVPEPNSNSVVVSGHQPELFHVGVWTKNFALAGVARNSGATAVNLIIDNDTMNSTSIRVPAGSRQNLKVNRIPFDAPQTIQPWEDASIRDRQILTQFGQRASSHVRSTWGIDPIIGTAWDAAVRQASVSNRLCDCLTAMRATVERRWGLANLELPMSKLCETRSFRWFTAHLLERLPELHALYNQTVAEYRRSHHLRNRMQPVPDLDVADGWYEAPFWIWRPGDFERGRLFGRRSGRCLELRDEKEVVTCIHLTDGGLMDTAVESLGQLSTRGYRLRTRALTTTLYARACLADLFVHGIGGAKYDAMTDHLFRELFGFEAPRFLTISATLFLPLGGAFPTTEADAHHARQRLRDLKYNPDRHLIGDVPQAANWIREKNQILQTAKSMRESGELRGRLTSDQHRRLEQLRGELRAHAEGVRMEYAAEESAITAQLSANKLLVDREFSFVLYPEEQLREFLTPLFTTTF